MKILFTLLCCVFSFSLASASQKELSKNFSKQVLHPSAFNYKVQSQVLKKLEAQQTANVIIYLTTSADLSKAEKIKDRTQRVTYVYDQLRKTALESQGPVLQKLREFNKSYKAFYIENAISVEGADRHLLKSLSLQPEVDQIRLNAKSQLVLPPFVVDAFLTPSLNTIPAHLIAIGVDKVWNELNVKGKGIVVAGQDTGYYWQHNAIRRQYRGFNAQNNSVDHNYNWHDAIKNSKGICGSSSVEPCDDDDHGTHTMGTIVGDDGGTNKIGVAPEAQWIGCRNMDAGYGWAASYLECFEYFLAPYPRGGNPQKDGRPDLAPHIINNSWGCPPSEGCTGGEFVEAIRALHAAGILVVVSAGNEGPGCSSVSSPPGTYADQVLSVAAFNIATDGIASFSSRGPSTWTRGLAPNISAPGTSIRSAIKSGPNSYDSFSGTSMAGPHIAGVVALLWSAKPELIGQIDRTKEILFKSADPKTSSQNCGSLSGAQVPNAVFGYGLVNAYKAIQSALQLK